MKKIRLSNKQQVMKLILREIVKGSEERSSLRPIVIILKLKLHLRIFLRVMDEDKTTN